MSQSEYTAMAAYVKQWREVIAQIEQLEKLRDSLKDGMIAVMDANQLDEFTGENFTVRYKVHERTTFDSKTFAKVNPEMFAQFSKSTLYTRFSIV